MNKIIEVPDISVVKTINGEKQLFSLRDQKIKKGTLHTFGAGSGVKCAGNLYVLDGGMIPIVRMTTAKVNPSFEVNKSGDITVDWGDGIIEENVFTHAYTDGIASHNIVFYGENTALTYLNCYYNQLSVLDVSRNIALATLYCDDNQLSALDVSQNTALTNLYCYNNPMTSNNAAICACANSLANRTSLSKGIIMVNDPTAKGWIQAICDGKNWAIT